MNLKLKTSVIFMLVATFSSFGQDASFTESILDKTENSNVNKIKI